VTRRGASSTATGAIDLIDAVASSSNLINSVQVDVSFVFSSRAERHLYFRYSVINKAVRVVVFVVSGSNRLSPSPSTMRWSMPFVACVVVLGSCRWSTEVVHGTFALCNGI